jgi:phospholipase/carboxylesterase
MTNKTQDFTLDYVDRAPASPSEPLVVLIHGRAGHKEVMLAFRRCIPDSFGLLLPEAPYEDPHDGGKSWWIINAPDYKEQMNSSLTQLAALIENYRSIHNLLPRSVIVAGFSQGGAMASLLLQEESIGNLHGVALLASFAIEKRELPLTSAPEVFLAHGTEDHIVPIEKATRSQEFFEGLGCEVLLVTDPVGHKVGRQGMRDLTEWFQSYGQG